MYGLINRIVRISGEELKRLRAMLAQERNLEDIIKRNNSPTYNKPLNLKLKFRKSKVNTRKFRKSKVNTRKLRNRNKSRRDI